MDTGASRATGGNDGSAAGQGRVYQASGDQHIVEYHQHDAAWSGVDSVRHPTVGRAPVRLRDRVAEMDRLRAGVTPGAGDSVYVLHGLGGCGKTAIAHALFRHATDRAGRVGLWVDASDPASLRAGMLAVAADRGATDAELTGARSGLRPAADLVWHRLDRSTEPWLLVLDNADTPNVLRDGGWLRTSPAGIVVVTTRQSAPHWWPGAELLQFGVLPRADAALVLRDLAPHAGSTEDAEAVADRLGHLPLALTLAGGFLSHQVIDPWDLADYCRRLDSGAGFHPIDLLDQGAGAGADSRHLLSRTWQLSLDALAAQGLPEATPLLRLLACWSGAPLPLKLLGTVEVGAELPAQRVESALRGLLDHSLTDLVPGGVRCLRTHGILLDSVAHATPDERRDQLAATAAWLLLRTLPEVPERGAQDPTVVLLAPHVLGLLRRVAQWTTVALPVVESAAECALRLVVAVHRSGDYASALTLARDSFAAAAARLPADHVHLLRLRLRIGRALFRLGQFAQAEASHRELLADCERVLGPDALDTLDVCLRLTAPLQNLGRGAEALALGRRVARGREAALGRTHPLTLNARKIVVETVASPDAATLGDRDEVLAAGPAVIEDCRRAMGADHPVTLGAILNQAFALGAANRPAEALPHARTALAGYERRYAPDYPILLNARHTLSVALHALGQRAEAIEQAELLVAGRHRVLGPDHPWTVSAERLLDQYRTRTPPAAP